MLDIEGRRGNTYEYEVSMHATSHTTSHIFFVSICTDVQAINYLGNQTQEAGTVSKFIETDGEKTADAAEHLQYVVAALATTRCAV